MKIMMAIMIAYFIAWSMGIICIFSDGHIFGRLFHKTLGWHFPDDNPKAFDGLSVHARCRFCGKEIMQDSQGNWFLAEH